MQLTAGCFIKLGHYSQSLKLYTLTILTHEVV